MLRFACIVWRMLTDRLDRHLLPKPTTSTTAAASVRTAAAGLMGPPARLVCVSDL